MTTAVLNQTLVERQGLSEEDVFLLETLHKRLAPILANKYEDNKTTAYLVEAYEAVMQDIWGFEVNSNYHIYWLKIQGCTCPRMDNAERWGHGRITVEDCPYHGRTKND